MVAEVRILSQFEKDDVVPKSLTKVILFMVMLFLATTGKLCFMTPPPIRGSMISFTTPINLQTQTPFPEMMAP